MERIECAVIGAGVIGLAIARALSLAGREVVILEAAGAFGTGISSRNSEVIHAGIYYPQGSLKARFCVEGKEMLYDFLASHGVAHRRCGKLIVACNDHELAKLENLRQQGLQNGVDDLMYLSAQDASKLEPALTCRAALLSPSTGIVDSHGLMLALLGDAQETGTMLALNSPVTTGHVEDNAIILEIGDKTKTKLRANFVINCAGLNAWDVARSLKGSHRTHLPPRYLAKGNYFSLTCRAPFSRLIYPLPDDAGLGIHLTLDLAGQARFGPDVEWIEELDWQVNDDRQKHFANAIRRYWPGLPDDALMPAFAGIRPKLVGPDEAAGDFLIQDFSTHGVASLVNLFGIESPGLTASLAIAEQVSQLIASR